MKKYTLKKAVYCIAYGVSCSHETRLYAGTIVHADIDPELYATTFITAGDRYTVDTASLLAAI